MKEQREHKRGRRITWLARAATHGLARAATHRLARAAACGLILAASLGWLRAAGTAELLPENILRLHVVANSDSQEDQSLKLLVRDAVLEEASRWCAGAESLEAANRDYPGCREDPAGAGQGRGSPGLGDGGIFPHQGV